MKKMEPNSIDSIVTDPPYGLSFMGKKWDYDVPSQEVWEECLRVLKPGGYLLAFAGTRTQHRMAVRIEDAGFEIRDMIAWIYSTGFPKSLNLNKALIKRCACGNMEAYDRATQKSESRLRFMQEADISQTHSNQKAEGEVLQSELQEQGLSAERREQFPTSKVREGQPSLEGWNNAEADTWKLSRDNLSEMSERVSVDGEEGRLHNATQVDNGSTPKQITDEDGSGASHRPQSEEQQNREPCAFCKQLGTQDARRIYEETRGFGSALKPAFEPITIARKPISEGTLIDNHIKWGVGGINIDESRVGIEERFNSFAGNKDTGFTADDNRTDAGKGLYAGNKDGGTTVSGRFPANLIHDGSQEVLELFPQVGSKSLPIRKTSNTGGTGNCYTTTNDNIGNVVGYGDVGSAARFFYCAKASKSERNKGCEGLEEKQNLQGLDNRGRTIIREDGTKTLVERFSKTPSTNNHPTVKPIALMKYLIKLVTPKGGIVLDPFAGSGSTLVAAQELGYESIGIELTADYIPIIEARLQ